MGENNKPFACSIEGCGMTFTNEDHLTVHKKKHDMSLNLGNGQKTNVFVADQTPTPTRFIRNCEEVGLFQDLQNVNPFEEQFRKAAEAVKSGAPSIIHEMDPLVGPQPDDMLHTPHVFPLIETVPSGSGAGPGGGHSSDLSMEKDKEKKSLDSSHVEKSQGSEGLPVSLNESDEIIVLNHLKKVTDSEDKAKEKAATDTILLKSSNDVKDIQNKDSPVHVLIRMPDGRLVQLSGLSVESPPPTDNTVGPISLPTNWPNNSNVPVVSNTIQSPVALPKPCEESANGKSQGLSLAKLKLKQVLLQNSSANKATPKKDHTAISWVGQKEIPISIERSVPVALPIAKPQLLSFKGDNSLISITQKKSGAAAVNRKRRKSSPEPQDTTEKRLKFLERNRAAASRCREKRKNWIKNLQRKCNVLETNNAALQSEIASLRAEVSQLRTSLLMHKDCPVTLMLQQQQSERPQQEDTSQRQNVQNSQSLREKKVGTVIRRHTPTLSISRASSDKASDPKPSSVNGRVAASQVLVMSSAQSLASQQGHILQRQQLLPAIGQTAVGSVLLPSTPESANVGVVCDLQAHREVTVSDPGVDKTVAVVVTNPALMHTVQISALNTVPVKLICSSPQLTDTIQRSNLKGESSSVKTIALSEKDKRKLSLSEGEKTTDDV